MYLRELELFFTSFCFLNNCFKTFIEDYKFSELNLGLFLSHRYMTVSNVEYELFLLLERYNLAVTHLCFPSPPGMYDISY